MVDSRIGLLENCDAQGSQFCRVAATPWTVRPWIFDPTPCANTWYQAHIKGMDLVGSRGEIGHNKADGPTPVVNRGERFR
jgi:hypothetical protein